ncbi:MAG: transposase [Collinsella sp.]
MSRKPRQKSLIGLYHITMRGNGKQLLFEDDEDRRRILSLVRSSIVRFNIRLIAWCLMGNHVHLVLSDPDDNVSEAMHLVMSCYATWYNRRHGHVGHVFQDRFSSAPISVRITFSTLFDMFISIQKAGICPYGAYRWSSHLDYVERDPDIATVDLAFVRFAFPRVRDYQTFMNASNVVVVRPSTGGRIDEDEALDVGISLVRLFGLSSFPMSNPSTRLNATRYLLQCEVPAFPSARFSA